MGYRVAVIENESESIRYGYANIVRKLGSLQRLRKYSFERFDSRNLDTLFYEKTLLEFDSLFIATNATSDDSTLSLLRQHRCKIDEFVSKGGGIYLSYQKKLTSKDGAVNTDFLPAELDVAAVERPEQSSADGCISSEAPHGPWSSTTLVLNYPEPISNDSILERCRDNEFKPHLYRAFLEPTQTTAYHTLIWDQSYPQGVRPLLLASRSSGAKDRVVACTIALDWEWHAQLLTNIVAFITEGMPIVAFVSGEPKPRGDFEYLIDSASLSKIPHAVYRTTASIPHELFSVHGIFILSPSCTEQEAKELWRRVKLGAPEARTQYKRLYRIDDQGGTISLIQQSNFSSVDLTIDSAVAWVDSRYRGGFWAGGFWNTTDVLRMLMDLDSSPATYLDGVLKDVKKHYRDGSYDGVVGATSGLLELMVYLSRTCPSELLDFGFGPTELERMACWVVDMIETQSLDTRQSSVLALAEFSKWTMQKGSVWRQEDAYRRVQLAMKRQLPEMISVATDAGSTELDLVRTIRFATLVGASFEELLRLLKALKSRQRVDGAWHSVGRTSHVVIGLLSCHDALVQLEPEESLNELIYKAVLYLMSTYDDAAGNWLGDIQATATAARAIGLHNKKYAFSTQELFETISQQIKQVDRSENIRAIRRELASIRSDVVTSREQFEKLEARSMDTKARHEQLERREFIWRCIGTVSTLLLTGVGISLFVNFRMVAKALISEFGSVLPLIAGAVLAVPVTAVLSQKSVERATALLDAFKGTGTNNSMRGGNG